jgi:hypothetical protein
MATSSRRIGWRSPWVLATVLLGFCLIWASGVLRPRPGSDKVLGEYHSVSIEDTELAYFTHEGRIVLVVWTDFTVC